MTIEKIWTESEGKDERREKEGTHESRGYKLIYSERGMGRETDVCIFRERQGDRE